MEIYRNIFIRCHTLDSFIIMQCNYIKRPAVITKTVYSDTMSSLQLQSMSNISAVTLI